MSNKTIIHIGLPKCASTSLQNLLITQQEIYYLGKKYNNRYRGDDLEYIFRDYLTKASFIEYDSVYVRSVLTPYIEEARESGKPIVLSDELFSGIGFNSFTTQTFIDPAQILSRLYELFDNVIFVVVIREQSRYLKSFYAQLVNHGYNLTYQQFVVNELSRLGNLKAVLSYGQLLRYMFDQFSDVKVLLFEELVKNKLSIADVLASYGVSITGGLPHSGPTTTTDELYKTLKRNTVEIRGCGHYPGIRDRIIARQLLSEQSSSPITASTLYQLDIKAESILQDSFVSENQIAGELLDCDLGLYGYLT